MVESLFGGETEYAVMGLSPHGSKIGTEEIAHSMLQRGRRRLVHLRDMGSPGGMFLANSSRLYLDCGTHPELATPECSDPTDVVRYIEAGHMILSGLASAIESEKPAGTEILLLRNNVDLSGSQSTWGCHESYMHRKSRDALRPHLIPHLVTRVIYTGAGGFNPFSHALEFMLSPRASHIHLEDTESSTSERGIWHSKTEPLCVNYQRLHVLCGESECSHTAMWLKFGVTALVVAMADAGFEPARETQLEAPVAALRTVATDVSCTARLETTDGDSRTAIAIQRIYLERAETFVEDQGAPRWASAVCARWREVLDSLESNPGSLGKTLDWRIKLALYEEHARKLGIQWEAIPVLNRVIDESCAALLVPSDVEPALPLAQSLRSRRLGNEVGRLESLLSSHGLGWDDVGTLLQSRGQFFELDTRFSQLGPKGVFSALDEAGVLDHRVPGIDNFEQAMEHPPAAGRAMLRGKVIRRLAGPQDCRCDWQRIVDLKELKQLDLSNPFTQDELWKPVTEAEAHAGVFPGDLQDWVDPTHAGMFSSIGCRQRALECYLSGDYSAAEGLLRECAAAGFELASTHCHLARTLMMQDREQDARGEIRRARASYGGEPPYVGPRILFFECLFAMLDGADGSHIVAQIKSRLLQSNAHLDWSIGPTLDHLRGRLGAQKHRFLCTMADALSTPAGLRRVSRLRLWRNADSSSSVPF